MKKMKEETKGLIWLAVMVLAVLIGAAIEYFIWGMISWRTGFFGAAIFMIGTILGVGVYVKIWASIAFKKLMSGEMVIKELFSSERERTLVGAAIKDFFKYTIGYTLQIYFSGEAEARPLFNLKISRVYDGLLDWKKGYLGSFEMNIERWQKSIMAAKKIIGDNVHVDERGRIWPGYIYGLPIRNASLNIAEQRPYLLALGNAFKKEEELSQHERTSHIHVEADEVAGLRAAIYQIYFDGRRAYLYEIDRDSVESKEMRRLIKKFA